ncbi:MAG: InlB B-repeat-containing protein [Erysipelotrichaceae bacterium]|jgi:uncharacterized repeat protein (TIGR02543 family)|nr:InlB B-repeat-containing protein [Erysipelotrichaceae bacterium]
MNKRICKLVSAFLVTLATLLGSLKATKADSFSVGSYADLHAALNSAATTIDITITASFEIQDDLAISTGSTVTITSDSGGPYVLSLSSTFDNQDEMFFVQTNSSLILSDIILSGKSGREDPLITNQGTLTLNSGAVLQNNENVTGRGGAIWNNNGTVYMYDGAVITNNSAGISGGGINSMGESSLVYIYGGTISNNSASDPGTSGGGGIAIYYGELQIRGGQIINNTSAKDGGGIKLNSPTAVGIQPVSASQPLLISGNHANQDGGAIYFDPGAASSVSLHLRWVNLSNNSAGRNGGGIAVSSTYIGKIDIRDSTLSGNSAAAAYSLTDSDLITIHDTLIQGSTYSKPFVYAYNNYDIEYTGGDLGYIVSFDTAGGSAIDPVMVAPDSKVTKPTNPTKSNKVFAGWYEDDAYANKYDFNSLVSSNKTLYGKWVDATDEVEYLVVFDSNGGSAVASEMVSYGDKVTKPVDPTKGGKVFAGWYSDDSFSNKYNFELPVTDDLTLYAKWVDSEAEISYVIFFNKNIPSGAVDGITSFPANAYLTSGNSFNITSALTPAGTPSKPGASYSFAGWGTSPTGAAIFKATAYHSGELFSSSTGKAILATIYGVGATINITDNDINLYAIWNVTNSSTGSGGSGGSGSGGSASAPLTGVPNVSGDFYPLILTMGIWLLVQNKKRKED